MAQTEVGPLTNWATQVPQHLLHFRVSNIGLNISVDQDYPFITF